MHAGVVLISGRTLTEYRAMFDLTDADLSGRVLDCCAGAASFAVEACAQGGDVTAVDPAYAWSSDVLADAVAAGLTGLGDLVRSAPDAFDWSWYSSPERHASLRREATSRFLLDRATNPGRYVPGALPDLPFPDASFDLVLCSHLLFTWAADLGESWHRAALDELVRVSRGQVRVYPLVGKAAEGQPPFLVPLVEELRGRGLSVTAVPVPMRFQRGAGHAMVIDRAGTVDV